MTRKSEMRWLFLRTVWLEVGIVWPIFSGLIAVQLGLGLLIGFLEDWSVGDAAYFAFVTGLTIGYGDLTPTHPFARVFALAIGLIGIVLTGLIAAIAVGALQVAREHDRRSGRDTD